MENDLWMMELARCLSEIASQTSDAKTAMRLVALANKVLGSAGLPPRAVEARSMAQPDPAPLAA